MKQHFYKSHGVILEKSKDWEEPKYGFRPEGIGDCIGRSVKVGLAHNDYTMVRLCLDLIQERKRWPDELEPVNGAENRIDYWISKIKYKLKIPSSWYEFSAYGDAMPVKKVTQKYRPQKSITRDPYIGVICAIELMPYFPLDTIKRIKIPWYLYLNAIDLYHWKKYLETGLDRHKRKYEWWALVNLKLSQILYKFVTRKMPMFALYHVAWMAYVAKSTKLQDKVQKFMPQHPPWNLLIWALTTHTKLFSWRLIKQRAEEYKPKQGYQWQSEEWYDERYIPESDKYKPDKDELNWVLNR